MNTFFKDLAQTLKDRQEFRMTLKKIEGDLVVTVVHDLKAGTSNIEMSGTPEEIDENFLTEINKPMSVETAFTSNADEVKNELEEAETEEAVKKTEKSPADNKSSSKKPAGKSKPKKTEKEADESSKAEAGEVEKEEEESEKLEEVIQLTQEEEKTEEAKIEPGEEVTAPTPEETKVDEESKEEKKQELEQADSDDAPPSPKEVFDHLISEGDKLFGLRDYTGAEASYKKALELFPEDEKAKKSAKKANQWVEALKNI